MPHAERTALGISLPLELWMILGVVLAFNYIRHLTWVQLNGQKLGSEIPVVEPDK